MQLKVGDKVAVIGKIGDENDQWYAVGLEKYKEMDMTPPEGFEQHGYGRVTGLAGLNGRRQDTHPIVVEQYIVCRYQETFFI